MTLRTTSRKHQGLTWLGAAFVALGFYTVLSRLLCGSFNLNLLDPSRYRIALPILIAWMIFVWETRWDGVKREKTDAAESKTEDDRSAERQGEIPLNAGCGGQESVRPVALPAASSVPPPSRDPLPGEAEYVQARGMKHQPIPDVNYDGEYLRLLAKSAELGYSRALVKLGEYALRRHCLVEAYYWLWRAKKNGRGNLDQQLFRLRSDWSKGGYRRESQNEYKYFSHMQGTIGYALLCIDSRYNIEAAKARLNECAPDILASM